MPGWRLLIDDALDGAVNMAIDQAILESVSCRTAPPTLRLYRWAVPTVTLGRFQNTADIDISFCRESGVDVVRRPTGGRGVLHDDELTYSLVASVDDGIPRGVAASYGHLAVALADAYRILGVEARVTESDHVSSSAACYLATTRADLAYRATKLSGSAQVWMHDTVLQHGSFVVTRDVAREAQAFRLAGDEARRLAGDATTIEQVLGRRPAIDEMVEAVTCAFSRTLGIDLRLSHLSDSEERRSSELTDGFMA